jgi:hypothetical protein
MKNKVKMHSVFGLIVGVFLLMTGCSKNVSTYDYSQNGMEKYRSFAFIPSDDTVNYKYLSDPRVADNMRDQITEELKGKGLYLDAANPDLLVLVHSKFNEEMDVQASVPAGYEYYAPAYGVNPYQGYYYDDLNDISYIGSGPGITAVEYTKGVVVVDLIDIETQKIVWRGKATDDIYNENKISQEMARNIEKIFDEFPM